MLQPSSAWAADVLILGDTRLTPVVNIISGIRKTLRAPFKVYPPSDIKGCLSRVVKKEDPKIVIALGREALGEALQLPGGVPVIYDLVVIPPATTRPNTTGFYMAVPVRQYVDLIRNYLHSIKKIAVLGNRDQLNVLVGEELRQTTTHLVKTPYELVDAVRRNDSADAILLLPDATLLSTTAMEEALLLSFRKGIPIFGVSEKQVKDGALLALVVDSFTVGKQIGEYASKTLRGVNVSQNPPSPSKKFDLYLNTETARRMGIEIPDEMMRLAKRSYP